jgi:hypothetical protein
MLDRSNIGTMFVLVKDGTDWTYQGLSLRGKPLCRPINSDIIIELDEEDQIKWTF